MPIYPKGVFIVQHFPIKLFSKQEEKVINWHHLFIYTTVKLFNWVYYSLVWLPSILKAESGHFQQTVLAIFSSVINKLYSSKLPFGFGRFS
jgi:hypothetical protein